ncbi:MAG: hypothetical protein ACI4O7_03930 [Aristaeellaceae bacterium]
MGEDEMRRLVQEAVSHRLSGLEENPRLARRIIAMEKGASPRMRRKLSVSLIIALLLALLTLGAALALTRSPLLERLFAPEEAVPQEVIDQIVAPEESAVTPLGVLSVDELLYDGSSLHVLWTVANPTGEPLLYTMEGFTLNGQPLHMAQCNLFARGAGSAGYLLGGEVDGVSLPASVTSFLQASGLGSRDASGAYREEPLPSGKAVLTVSAAVWRPVNPPALFDYKAVEGVNVDPEDTPVRSLQADESGYCQLQLFRPAQYQALSGGADAWAEAYRALGWAEPVGTMAMTLELELSTAQLTSVVPEQTAFDLGDCTLSISQFDCSRAGGRCQLQISGDPAALARWRKSGLYLVDWEGRRVLNQGCIRDDQTGDGSLHFTMTIQPIAGELPTCILICPEKDFDDRWNEASPFYDPGLTRPGDVIGSQQFDLERAVTVPLRPGP